MVSVEKFIMQMALSDNWISGSPNFQIVVNFRQLECEITDYAKESQSENDASQKRISGIRVQASTGTQHGAGWNQSVCLHIPFSLQPEFREPVNQRLGKKSKFQHCLMLQVSWPELLFVVEESNTGNGILLDSISGYLEFNVFTFSFLLQVPKPPIL